MSLRKKDVWMHFFLAPSNETKAMCYLCRAKISRGGITSRRINKVIKCKNVTMLKTIVPFKT